MSEYFKTSERPPTGQDANAIGDVHGWDGQKWWSADWRAVKYNPHVYSHWMPQPPPPKSASDEAFEAWVKTNNHYPVHAADKRLWDAAVAWQKGQP